MADNKTTATELLERLHNMAIFRLSLGSKELFHSNFLEYLWDCDKESFKEIIRNLCGDNQVLTADQKYFISREKENFDVCIYHTSNNEEDGKAVYDVIIENKVKSIPYKEQLEEYVKKVAQKQESQPAYILLSLSKYFPDKGDNDVIDVSVEIKDKKHIPPTVLGKWKIISYSQLKGEIEKHDMLIKQAYVKDYCSFIETLDKLGEAALENIENDCLFPAASVEAYKKKRLHDLFIKMRCSWFAATLKQRLKIKGIPVRIVSKYEERLPGCVNLNVAMNQGNGQIAAWICDRNMNTFEIVVQGDQYRHGINQIGIKKSKSKEIENDYYQVKENDRASFKHFVLNWLYGRLENLQDVNAYNFLNFLDDFICFNSNQSDIRPESKKDKVYYFRKTKTPKAGPFDCYSDDYIYRYVSISNCAVQTLRDKMLNDILRIFHNLPDLS